MDLKTIALFIITALLFGIGFLVYFRNRKNIINISYGLFIIFMAVWSFGLAMFYNSQNVESTFFWTKFLYSAGSLIATFFFYFSLFFPSSKASLSFLKKILIFVPSVILLVVFLFSDFILKDVVILSGAKSIIYGPGHFLFDLQFDAFFILGFISLVLKYRISSGRAKAQLRYIILGTFLGLAIAGTTNVILPWFDNFEYLWIGPPGRAFPRPIHAPRRRSPHRRC